MLTINYHYCYEVKYVLRLDNVYVTWSIVAYLCGDQVYQMEEYSVGKGKIREFGISFVQFSFYRFLASFIKWE